MQSVDVEKGIIKFENYSNQLSVPFKIYADFECNLKDTETYEGSCTKKYHIIIDLVSQLLFTVVKMLLMNLLKQFLKNISIVK